MLTWLLALCVSAQVGYSWSGPYYRAAGMHDACNGAPCHGSNMTMCWNENTAAGSDEAMYDTANAKHGIEVMRNASKSEQPFFIALGIQMSFAISTNLSSYSSHPYSYCSSSSSPPLQPSATASPS